MDIVCARMHDCRMLGQLETYADVVDTYPDLPNRLKCIMSDVLCAEAEDLSLTFESDCAWTTEGEYGLVFIYNSFDIEFNCPFDGPQTAIHVFINHPIYKGVVILAPEGL